eukprot:superscaffoldBa00010887_g24942
MIGVAETENIIPARTYFNDLQALLSEYSTQALQKNQGQERAEVVPTADWVRLRVIKRKRGHPTWSACRVKETPGSIGASAQQQRSPGGRRDRDMCCTFIPNNTAPDGKVTRALEGLRTLSDTMHKHSGIDNPLEEGKAPPPPPYQMPLLEGSPLGLKDLEGPYGADE